jgi:hypothetical protein
MCVCAARSVRMPWVHFGRREAKEGSAFLYRQQRFAIRWLQVATYCLSGWLLTEAEAEADEVVPSQGKAIDAGVDESI